MMNATSGLLEASGGTTVRMTIPLAGWTETRSLLPRANSSQPAVTPSRR
jgi:hypothetical protein